MRNEMFYRGNGLPSDFQRSSNSARVQSSLQHYGDLYADDSRHFVPFHSSNQQYLAPEDIYVSPEFHMFQANSRHFDRLANERNSIETDYMMRSRGNDVFGEPRGMNLNPFNGEKMFHPMASTRTCTKHFGSAKLSANDFDRVSFCDLYLYNSWDIPLHSLYSSSDSVSYNTFKAFVVPICLFLSYARPLLTDKAYRTSL